MAASAAEKVMAKAAIALCADKISGVKNKIDASNAAAIAEDFATAKTEVALAIARNGRMSAMLQEAQQDIEACV